MSGSTLAVILIPVVVAVCLAVWIAMVFRADSNPDSSGPDGAPDREVTGGIFRGDPRQLSPRRDAPPAEAASADEDTPASRSDQR